MMDYNHLKFGTDVASEAQLRYGTTAQIELKTGPNENYSMEADGIVKAEVVKRDPRVKNASDVQIESNASQYRTFFAGINDKRVGYLGTKDGISRLQTFFCYIIRAGKRTEIIFGMGSVTLRQQKVMGIFVKEFWTLTDFRITHRE